jgi:crotonobetainyl-CoA hydratase
MTGVHIDKRGAVLEVTLDRPKANAIDSAASRALGEAFVTLRDDPALHVAIVTGVGDKFFSAGWDLKAVAAGDSTDYGAGGFAGLTELFDLAKPVISAVNGLAVGGGFELALAADLIVAADHAEFFLPEVTLGIIPDAGGVLRLPRRLSRALATEMLMTGSRPAWPRQPGSAGDRADVDRAGTGRQPRQYSAAGIAGPEERHAGDRDAAGGRWLSGDAR